MLIRGVTLMVIFCCLTSSGACPGPCVCEETVNQDGQVKVQVDCRMKKLEVLPDLSTLQGLEVYRIYLDGNRLTSLPGGAFSGLQIEGLQLAGNPITNVSDDAFSGMLGTLKYLSLRSTFIDHSPTAFLSEVPKLEVLDLGGIMKPSFAVLTPGMFAPLAYLEELSLSKSFMLSKILPGAFQGLSSLKILKLEMCRLRSVPAEALGDLPGLVSLHLDQNIIIGIAERSFHKLKKLQTLTMSGNRLENMSHIHVDAFAGLEQSLVDLDLSVNNLLGVPSHAFHSLKGLKKLHIEDNLISDLQPGSFSELKNLEELDLSTNKIRLNQESLKGIDDTLQVLKLAHMNLDWDTLPLDTLKSLPNLHHIDLTGNPLKTVPQAAFEGLSVHHITLTYCKIEEVHPDAFSGLPPPITVQLNNNKINNVTFLSDPCHFQTVELFKNPVHCDCHFRQVSLYKHMILVGECSSPPEHEGHLLQDFARTMTQECQGYTVISGEQQQPEIQHKECQWKISQDKDDRPNSSTMLSSCLIVLISNLLIVWQF